MWLLDVCDRFMTFKLGPLNALLLIVVAILMIPVTVVMLLCALVQPFVICLFTTVALWLVIATIDYIYDKKHNIRP